LRLWIPDRVRNDEVFTQPPVGATISHAPPDDVSHGYLFYLCLPNLHEEYTETPYLYTQERVTWSHLQQRWQPTQ
jgi:hypothetical protein